MLKYARNYTKHTGPTINKDNRKRSKWSCLQGINKTVEGQIGVVYQELIAY